MVQLSIQFEDSPDELEVVGALVDHLRSRHRPTRPPEDQPVDAWNVAAWYGHLGQGSRRFWEVAARHSLNNDTWTFDDLEAASGIDKNTLRSYHRNSYRAIRDENAPDPLRSDWNVDQACNVYQMPEAVRDELHRLVEEDDAAPAGDETG
jgi:hypothetical protein